MIAYGFSKQVDAPFEKAAEDVGLLLPCNVIVCEKDGGTAVSIIKPTVAMQMVDHVRSCRPPGCVPQRREGPK